MSKEFVETMEHLKEDDTVYYTMVSLNWQVVVPPLDPTIYVARYY